MTKEQIIEEYYDYLLDIIDFRLPEHRKFGKLLEFLFSTKFIWIHPMDENRLNDGLYLRREFLFDFGLDVNRDLWDDPGNVLEVLTAFSKRVEIEITGEPGNDNLGRWFWEMLENLGVLYSDYEFDSRIVGQKVEKWLCRKFGENGKGGILPLRKTTRDQRDVEMWYQMQEYLNENWNF